MTVIDDRLEVLGLKPIDDRFVPASAVEVRELENRLGHPLPGDYCHFLLTYGYAMFGDLVSARLPNGEEAPVAIFFGGGASRAPIMKQLVNYQDQLPHGVVPIGRDPFGNLFLLRVGSEDLGRVWYASFEDDVESVPVADSFEEFLARLTVDPD